MHPVTMESNAISALSNLTGLEWHEINDHEIIWFMLRGMRPVPRVGPYDGKAMKWECRKPGVVCGYVSPWGRADSHVMRESVRQHLRDRHQEVRR